MAKKQSHPCTGKVGNHNQVAGIETSVLDNGGEKGVRIAWVNTGGGLRYKVVLDRACDIVDAFINEKSLSWLSHNGIVPARPDSDHDIEWLGGFAGGMVTTCGLTHFGPPETDQAGHRGLHGKVSNCGSYVESVVQPDPARGKMDMSITAVVKESRIFGPSVEMWRTISSTVGEAKVRIHDEVTNCGNLIAPHMILYHCNFGWPLIDEGTEIIYKGAVKSRGNEIDDAMFAGKENYKVCKKPLDMHKGFGESVGFIDADCDRKGMVTVGFNNKKAGLAVVMTYNKKELPWLTNWQHFGEGEYLCALEPGTNPPVGRIRAKRDKQLVMLRPGQTKTYDLEISVLTDAKEIANFVKSAG